VLAVVAVVAQLCVAAVAAVAAGAAAAHAGDGAAFAKFHDLTDERQNLTNCHAADRGAGAGTCSARAKDTTAVCQSTTFRAGVIDSTGPGAPWAA